MTSLFLYTFQAETETCRCAAIIVCVYGLVAVMTTTGVTGVFDNELTLKFHPDAKLASAKIVNAEWDDHMRVTLDGTQIFAHIDGAYRESDYPAPKGSWELKNRGNSTKYTM